MMQGGSMRRERDDKLLATSEEILYSMIITKAQDEERGRES